MLSTTQARSLFERLSTCLAEIKAKVDVDDAGVQWCLTEMAAIIRELGPEFASPHGTWQKLLKHKVRQHTPHVRPTCILKQHPSVESGKLDSLGTRLHHNKLMLPV
jgi:hypothetical protein